MSQLVRYLTQGEINPIDTLTGNTGGPVGPTAGNINVVGTGVISVAGNPATSTLTISSAAITGITITGDSGGALGPSTAFTFTGGSTGITFSGSGTTETLVGTLNVAHGGTGDTSFTAYAPICGGTTTTGVLQSASTGIGTSGWVLTSNGSAALPTWQATAPSGIITINGDTGSVTGNPVTFNANSQAGSTVKFTGSGTTMSFNVSDGNGTMIIGNGSGVASPGSQNTILGAVSGNALLNTSSNNTAIGTNTVKALSSGTGNAALGWTALQSITNGSYNIAIGAGAGGTPNAGESHNILLNNNGNIGESHTLRIGAGTGSAQQQLQNAYISGISGVNVGSVASVVSISGDHLGSTTITAGSGISITAGANTITAAISAPVSIANGGTNATSMSTSTGIVKYDGTSLVTSSTAKISSSNYMTNSGQPAFNVNLNTSVSNVTGNAGVYTILFDTVSFDQTSGYNSGTGIFTAPIAGNYIFGCGVIVSNLAVANNNINLNIVTTSNTYGFDEVNVGTARSTNNRYGQQVQTLAPMAINDTCKIQIEVDGGVGNTVGVLGGARTYFYGYLAC